MTGSGHLLIGTSVTLVVIAVAGPSITLHQAIVTGVVGITSALLADLDTPHSILKNKIFVYGRAAWVGRVKRRSSAIEVIFISLAGAVEMAIRLFIYVLLMIPSIFLEHRTLTHYLLTPLFIWAVTSPLLSFFHQPQLYGVAFFVGYLSHLLVDCFTYSGVQLFAPIYTKPIHLLPQRLRFTNRDGASLGEKISIAAICITAIGFILFLTK